jgi:four helix bundle protein
VKDFRTLSVWQKAKSLAVLCYQVSRDFPKEEVYGLSSQVRRSSVSISANIAEGVGRDSDAELLRFIRIALGSLYELETLLEIAYELQYLSSDQKLTIDAEMRDLGIRLRNFAARLGGSRSQSL